MLRVGFDGRAFSSPAAGIRRYSTELVRALISLGEPVAVVSLGGDPRGIPTGLQHVAGSAHPPSNAGWTLIGLPRTAARAGVDLIHAPPTPPPSGPAFRSCAASCSTDAEERSFGKKAKFRTASATPVRA